MLEGNSVGGFLNVLDAGSNMFMMSRLKACFIAGTPILTPEGWKAVEEIGIGERVLSRDENDAAGEVRSKAVLATFVRVSPVLYVHVGGKLIGTTGEHPFYVDGKGWVEARSLRIGDLLVSRTGQFVPVEGVADSGRIELVYNFEVEDDHTYFVGKDEWGWDVWVHNAGYYNSALRTRPSNEVAELRAAFNSKDKVAFVKKWAATSQAKRMLDPDELKMAMRKGELPDGLVVHHKVPLYRGGTNDYSNLRVMTQQFHHKFRDPLHNYPVGQNPYGMN